MEITFDGIGPDLVNRFVTNLQLPKRVCLKELIIHGSMPNVIDPIKLPGDNIIHPGHYTIDQLNSLYPKRLRFVQEGGAHITRVKTYDEYIPKTGVTLMNVGKDRYDEYLRDPNKQGNKVFPLDVVEFKPSYFKSIGVRTNIVSSITSVLPNGNTDSLIYTHFNTKYSNDTLVITPCSITYFSVDKQSTNLITLDLVDIFGNSIHLINNRITAKLHLQN